MAATGVDYAWSHPAPAALKGAGVHFVLRYLSTDRTKSLTRAEADALAEAGIWCGVVWETTDDRMLAGRTAGAMDAAAAAAQAGACGMPSSRPIFFAADFDVTEEQVYAITAYLAGAASVLGAARVGIYGGLAAVRRALDSGHATWAWQTTAWSGGQWDPRAHIRQGGTVSIGGVDCDRDQAMKDDFGQWMPGTTPQEAHVALTAADAKTLLTTDGIIPAPAPPVAAADYATNKSWTMASSLAAANQAAREANANTEALLKQVTALSNKVDALSSTLKALNATGLLDQLQTGLAGIEITLNVKEGATS